MKVAVFSIHNFEKDYLLKANGGKHELVLLETRLSETSAPLAHGCEAVCLFVEDSANAPVLEMLHKEGIKYIALRSAGFNNTDLKKVKELGMQAARVPAYSPNAVAEHTVALMLALNRKLIRSHNRVMDLNFSLDGLTGFDMNGKTAGIMGTGKIGCVLARILYGFGCRLLAFDVQENKELAQQYKVTYTDRNTLYKESDIISLHLPLTSDTKYIIDKTSVDMMKPGVMLINTSRGQLVNTLAVINALKSKQVGFFGMDVYEEEEGLFFEDHSEDILLDDKIARLMTFKNVIITSHQAFLTDTGLKNIAETTIYNLECFEKNIENKNIINA